MKKSKRIGTALLFTLAALFAVAFVLFDAVRLIFAIWSIPLAVLFLVVYFVVRAIRKLKSRDRRAPSK